jgi:predicted DNA-binding WGR domain protein
METANRFTGYVRLESVNPATNRARFYTLRWQPTLWGTGALVRTWGRIGTPGRAGVLLEAERPRVDAAVERLVRRRLQHGYTLVDWSPSPAAEVPS